MCVRDSDPGQTKSLTITQVQRDGILRESRSWHWSLDVSWAIT